MTDTKRKDVLEGLDGYTPGPWRMELNHPECNTPPRRIFYITSDDCSPYMEIATLYEAGHGVTSKHNATLTARAPELVEEIRELRERLQDYVDADEVAQLEGGGIGGSVEAEARALLPETEDE